MALSSAASCGLSRNCSLSRSGALPEAACFAPMVARPPMVALPPRSKSMQRSSRLVVRAQQQEQPPHKDGMVAGIRSSCERFLQRYDPVTTGMGSLVVTGYAVVAHHQTVGEALNIAACATVLGMVLQEVLFNDNEANNNA